MKIRILIFFCLCLLNYLAKSQRIVQPLGNTSNVVVVKGALQLNDTVANAPTGSIAFVNDGVYSKTSLGWIQLGPAGGGFTPAGSSSQYIKGNGTYGTFPTAVSSFTNDANYLSTITGYTQLQINSFFGGTTVIGGYNKPNWDNAFSWGNHAGLYPTISRFNDSLAAHWAAIQAGISPGIGNMTKAVYDPGDNGVVDSAQDAAKFGNQLPAYYQAALNGTGIVKSVGGTISYLTDFSTDWNTAYTDRLKWDGGSTGLIAATGRTSLGFTTGWGLTGFYAVDSALVASRWRLKHYADSLFALITTPTLSQVLIAGNSYTYTGVGTAMQLTATNANGNVLLLTNSSTNGNGLSVYNNASNGMGAYIENADVGTGLFISNYNTSGKGLIVDGNSTSGNPFTIQRSGVNKFFITNAGLAKYSANYGSSFDSKTLVDKGYVDSLAGTIGGFSNPMTTNGDLITRISGLPARLGIGSTGDVLQVVSGLPAWAPGVSWSGKTLLPTIIGHGSTMGSGPGNVYAGEVTSGGAYLPLLSTRTAGEIAWVKNTTAYTQSILRQGSDVIRTTSDVTSIDIPAGSTASFGAWNGKWQLLGITGETAGGVSSSSLYPIDGSTFANNYDLYTEISGGDTLIKARPAPTLPLLEGYVDASTITIDHSVSDIDTVNISSNRTIAITNLPTGDTITTGVIFVKHTVAGTTVTLPGSGLPTGKGFSTGSGEEDMLTYISVGGRLRWDITNYGTIATSSGSGILGVDSSRLINDSTLRFYIGGTYSEWQRTAGGGGSLPSEPDADAQRFIDSVELTHALDATEENRIHALVNALKVVASSSSVTVWSKITYVRINAGTTANSHKWNLKNPGAYTATYSGSPTHSDRLVDYNGSSYADSHLPSSDLPVNDVSLFFWSEENTSNAGGIDMGTNIGSNRLQLNATFDGSAGAVFVSGDVSLAVVGSNTAFDGFFVGTRTSSTVQKIYRNAVEIGSNTGTNTGSLTIDHITEGANGTGTTYSSNRGCSIYGAALGLTAEEITILYNAFNDYRQ